MIVPSIELLLSNVAVLSVEFTLLADLLNIPLIPFEEIVLVAFWLIVLLIFKSSFFITNLTFLPKSSSISSEVTTPPNKLKVSPTGTLTKSIPVISGASLYTGSTIELFSPVLLSLVELSRLK